MKSSSLLHNIQLKDLSFDQSGLGVSSDEVSVLMEGFNNFFAITNCDHGEVVTRPQTHRTNI